jgi:hypothetical protein
MNETSLALTSPLVTFSSLQKKSVAFSFRSPPIMIFNDQRRKLSRREDEGGASAPTLHPHYPRPYNRYESSILIGNIHYRGYVLDKSTLYCLETALEAVLERYVSSMFHFETDLLRRCLSVPVRSSPDSWWNAISSSLRSTLDKSKVYSS